MDFEKVSVDTVHSKYKVRTLTRTFTVILRNRCIYLTNDFTSGGCMAVCAGKLNADLPGFLHKIQNNRQTQSAQPLEMYWNIFVMINNFSPAAQCLTFVLWEQFDITIKLTNPIGFHADPERRCSRPSVGQLKLSRSWLMQQDKNPKHRSETGSSRETQWQSWCFAMSSREQFTPDIPRILLKLNCFVVQNSNYVKLLVEVIEENVDNHKHICWSLGQSDVFKLAMKKNLAFWVVNGFGVLHNCKYPH